MGNQTSGRKPKKYNGFTEAEVETIKNNFEKIADHRGVWDFKDASKINAIYAAQNPRELEAIFSFFDVDGERSIDSYKFICGLALIRQSSIKEKAELIFDIYNFDKDKILGDEELESLYFSVNNTLARFSGKNEVVEGEIKTLVGQMMKKYDHNKDECVSKDEFIDMFLKERKLLDLLDLFGLVTFEDENDADELMKNQGDDDQDLEAELNVKLNEVDERAERIKSGIEFNEEDNDILSQAKETQGDEKLATNAWVGAVKASCPSGYKPAKGDSNPPDANLVLEYIHGYRCHDVRNNLKYGPKGEIVYHTAAVGIVLDPRENKQRFFMEHTDDILCLDVFDIFVVTGQIGHKPLICVWNMETMESLVILKGVLEKGINNVCFSQDGSLFAATSIDEDHTILICDRESAIKASLNPTSNQKGGANGVVIKAKGPKSDILDLKFSRDKSQLIAACNKEMQFLSVEAGKGILKSQRGVFGKFEQIPILCIAFLKNDIVTGNSKGSLYVWSGNSLSRDVKAHASSCNALWSNPGGTKLISGGNDNTVIIWDENYKILNKLDLSDPSIGSMNPKIRSIFEMGGKTLVGTRGSEIVEFDSKGPKVLIRGHYDDELWGLCTHPSQSIYFTCGEEGLIASWDIQSHKQIKAVDTKMPAKTCYVSPNGKYLAVGTKIGQILILDPKTLAIVNNIDVPKKLEVSVLKFSPDSQLLAVGIVPPSSEVFVYSTSKFSQVCKLKGNLSRVTHMDFSESGQVLQTNSTSYEILYYDTSRGDQLKSGASQNKDERWASWTCVIGWPVQGIWPPCSDGSDINSVDRSEKRDVLVTADDFGKVKIFKYPVAQPNAGFKKYTGHSAHVTGVRFTYKNSHIISTGGGEKSIFQWRYIFDEDDEKEAQKIIDNDEDEEAKAGDDDILGMDEDKKADEMGAVKPYLGQIKAPSWYKSSGSDSEAPKSEALEIQYCHGYRCFDDYRNTAKFVLKNKVAFVGAALGVVMDPNSRAQSFFNKHEEDIVSMAIHPSGTIVATGQMAAKGKAKALDLYVWDANTKEAFCNLNQFHRRAICQLSFSPDGKKLLSVGQDDDNSLAIFDWQSKALMVTSNVDKAKVTGTAWKDNNQFVTIGLKHIKFWTMNGRNLNSKRGNLGAIPWEHLTCVTYCFDNNSGCVTGSIKGGLIYWTGDSGTKPVQAHTGEVGCLLAKNKEVYSGGADGKVIIWTLQGGTLTKGKEVIAVDTVSKYNPGIRTLDFDESGTMLVGSRGSELFVRKSDSGSWKRILQGHFDGEVWGCAASPDKQRFVTCGGDNTIRLWNAETNEMICGTIPGANDIRAVDWAPNGKYIVAAEVKGTILLIDPETLNIRHSFASIFKPDPKKKGDPWIEDIKVSPDSSMVAFGAHGGNFRIQILSCNGKELSKFADFFAGITSSTLHLDWSTDGSVIVLNSQAYELKFLSVHGKKDVSASSAKDTEWFTWTCLLGWYSQGVLQGVDGTDVNSVCRSNNKKILASGDDFGKVNLFKYPSPIPRSKCKSFAGHSSHVTKVKFSFDDSYLCSTGGNDKCVIVWRTNWGNAAGAPAINDEDKEAKEEEEDLNVETVKAKIKKKGKDKFESKSTAETNEEDAMFEVEVEKGDEFMAVKPWLGAIKEPSGWKGGKGQNQKPNVSLELDYVFGYRAKDCRNNLRYLKDGKIVYNAAALGIVLDPIQNTQKFFRKHVDDITALAVHPDNVRVATGEVGPKPYIFIWDAITLETKAEFKGVILKGIAALAFSPSGDRLVAVAIDDEHFLAVIDVKNSQVLDKKKSGPDVVIALAFGAENEFITVGAKHYKCWPLDGSGKMGRGNGDKAPSCAVCCAEPNGNDYVVGLSTGEVQVYQKASFSRALTKGSEGTAPASIDALHITKELIFFGGKEGKISVFDKAYKPVLEFDARPLLKDSFCPRIRSICLSADQRSLLVGTYGSEIYELSTNDKKISSTTKFAFKKRLMVGHYTPNQKWTNEVWGLAVFPSGDKYVTTSDDGTIRIWSTKDRKVLVQKTTTLDASKKETLKDPKTDDLQDSVKGRCVEVSQDEKMISVGFKDGTVKVYDANTLDQLKCFKCAKEWISDIKFSPDNSKVAIGSHDNALYVYSYPEFKRLFAPMRKHSSYITHLDWSENSVNLHSNCGAYELLFWDANSGKQLPGGASALRDENWATWTCVLGWPVQGIWPLEADGTDINYVDRSKSKHPDGYYLLASGDDFSTVKIFRYPSLVKNSDNVVGRGHSSHIPCVKWGPTDEYLYSVGGEDNCVFQWRVTK